MGNFQTINTPASGLHRHELLFLALGLVRYGQLQQAPLYHRENVPCHEVGNGDIILEAFFQFAACPWPCAKIKDTLLERGQGFFFFCDGVVQRNTEHSVGALELGWLQAGLLHGTLYCGNTAIAVFRLPYDFEGICQVWVSRIRTELSQRLDAVPSIKPSGVFHLDPVRKHPDGDRAIVRMDAVVPVDKRVDDDFADGDNRIFRPVPLRPGDPL